MTLMLRNRKRDERVERIRQRLDELLCEGADGRAVVREKLTELEDQLRENEENP